MSEHRGDGPLYPVERAFVIQLTRDADCAADLLTGKIEHLASGSAACFGNLGELNEQIRRMTAAPGTAPAPCSEPEPRRES